MNINKVDNAINECTNHLIETNSKGTEIESYFTKYLLILISACFEEEIERIFIQRAEKSSDEFLIHYFKNEIPNKLKSVGIGKLSNFIQRFGEEYKTKFIQEISTSQEATQYSNLITNRHAVAHETKSINMSYDEVVQAYQDSNVILDKIKSILE